MTDETRYVLLNAGDVIQDGDEYWLVDKPNWLPSGYVGSKVPPGFLYRRADAPLPDHAALLAAALKLPEVRALVEAAKAVEQWDAARGYPIPYRVRDPLRAALAPLTGANP